MTVQMMDQAGSVEVLRYALEHQVHVCLAVRRGNRWLAYDTQLLGVDDQHVDLAPDAALGPSDLLRLTGPVSLSIRIGNRTYTGPGEVTGAAQTSGTRKAIALKLAGPLRRIDARTHERYLISEKEQARGAFWLGGTELKPSAGGMDPLWTGTLTDLSLGGFQIRSHGDACQLVRRGDLIGATLMFNLGKSSVDVDAHLCHIRQESDSMAMYGFRFDLSDGSAMAGAMDFIKQKIDQYRQEQTAQAPSP